MKKLIFLLSFTLCFIYSDGQKSDCRTSVTYNGWTVSGYTIVITNKMPVSTYYHIIYPNGVSMYTNYRLPSGTTYFTYPGSFSHGMIRVMPTESGNMCCPLNWVNTEYFYVTTNPNNESP